MTSADKAALNVCTRAFILWWCSHLERKWEGKMVNSKKWEDIWWRWSHMTELTLADLQIQISLWTVCVPLTPVQWGCLWYVFDSLTTITLFSVMLFPFCNCNNIWACFLLQGFLEPLSPARESREDALIDCFVTQMCCRGFMPSLESLHIQYISVYVCVRAWEIACLHFQNVPSQNNCWYYAYCKLSENLSALYYDKTSMNMNYFYFPGASRFVFLLLTGTTA